GTGESGYQSRMVKRLAEIMKSPSSAASQRYSGQWSRSARIMSSSAKSLWSNAFDVEPHPVKPAARTHIERLPAVITPGEDDWMLRRGDRSGEQPLWRTNP